MEPIPLSKPLKIRNYAGHRAAIYDLMQGEKEGIFYSVGGDGWIVQWDSHQNSADGVLIAQTDTQIFCGHVIQKTSEMVVGDMNGHLYWINLQTKEIKHRYAIHRKSIFAIQAIDDEVFVTASGDGCMGIWDIEKKQLRMTLQLSHQGLRSLAFNEGILYVGGSDNAIHRVNTATWKVMDKIDQAHDNSVFCLLAQEQGLLSGGRDAHLKLRNWEDLRTVSRDIPAHWFTINKIIALPEFEWIATASRDKTIRLWLPSCEPVTTIDYKISGHTHSVNTLLWLPQNNKLLSAGDDRTIKEYLLK